MTFFIHKKKKAELIKVYTFFLRSTKTNAFLIVDKGVSSRGEKGHLPPYDMPLMKFKIVCLEGIGRRHQNKSLNSYNKIFCPPLVCYVIGAEQFLGGVEDLRITFCPPKN